MTREEEAPMNESQPSRDRDPLDDRWFAVDDERWSALNDRLDQPAQHKPRLAELLERSSFGTDGARELRGAISDDKVARVLRRVGELDAEREDESGAPRRCQKCNGVDWRTRVNGNTVCRDCEKRHKRERKDRRHREAGDRCGCGTDAVSLNPAEIVVHNWGGGPCRVVPVERPS